MGILMMSGDAGETRRRHRIYLGFLIIPSGTSFNQQLLFKMFSCYHMLFRVYILHTPLHSAQALVLLFLVWGISGVHYVEIRCRLHLLSIVFSLSQDVLSLSLDNMFPVVRSEFT